jgi:hypothetical protein
MTKRDASKERCWRRLIRQQGKTGETVARFCAREGVPPHQFYWWKRTLRTRQGSSTSPRRNGQRPANQSEPAEQSFVPVRLPLVAHPSIEVLHPGGCLVRVPAGFDPHALRRILATLSPSADDAEN